ncbi:MAG: O-antigen ligase family protein [Giesbergeria sp.]|jgi:O-antigen ligase|nr:O-antigen ligase family protein [Giesbergeria sp.]
MDAWIAWFFAAMLTIPLAGEVSLLASMFAALVLVFHKGRHSGAVGCFSSGFWACALAIASVVVVKGVSWCWSIAPAYTLDATVNHLHFLLWAPLVLLFVRAQEPLEAMLLGVRIATVGLLAWSVCFWWQNGTELHPWIRLEAGAQNPGVLGQLATVFALWMGWLWRQIPSRVNLLWVVLAVCPVIAAGGRSHIVVMAAGLALISLMFVWRAKKSLGWHVGVVVLGVTLASGLGHALAPRMLQAWQEVQDYQHDSISAVGSSVGNRIGLYHVAWQAFPDSPWVGFGAGTSRAVVERYSPIAAQFAVIRHYHQQLIQVIMEAGLLGLFACIAALGVITRWMCADRHVSPYYLMLVGVTAGVGMFTGSLQQGLIHTFIVTVLAVLGAQRLKFIGGNWSRDR